MAESWITRIGPMCNDEVRKLFNVGCGIHFVVRQARCEENFIENSTLVRLEGADDFTGQSWHHRIASLTRCSRAKDETSAIE